MEELKLKRKQLEKKISNLIVEFAKEINNNDLDVEICIYKVKQGSACAITNIEVNVNIKI